LREVEAVEGVEEVEDAKNQLPSWPGGEFL